MKKIMKAAAALVTAAALAGCSDATAKLNDAKTTVMTIGSSKITKGDIYTVMNNIGGASQMINDATKIIVDAEVEITDEMKESAKSSLEMYKSLYGDSFTDYLESSGMTEEDYMNTYLIPSLQADELTNKYVEEHFDELIATYKPVKAVILTFTSQTDADAALSELKDGSATAAEAAKNHNSTSSGDAQIVTTESSTVDSAVRTMLLSDTPFEGWISVTSADGASFYLVKMESNDPSAFKDEAVEALADTTGMSSKATTFYFEKHGFHIYDKPLYDAVAQDYADYLVQDKTQGE